MHHRLSIAVVPLVKLNPPILSGKNFYPKISLTTPGASLSQEKQSQQNLPPRIPLIFHSCRVSSFLKRDPLNTLSLSCNKTIKQQLNPAKRDMKRWDRRRFTFSQITEITLIAFHGAKGCSTMAPQFFSHTWESCRGTGTFPSPSRCKKNQRDKGTRCHDPVFTFLRFWNTGTNDRDSLPRGDVIKVFLEGLRLPSWHCVPLKTDDYGTVDVLVARMTSSFSSFSNRVPFSFFSSL